MCSVVREAVHMHSSCTPCSYYEYDAKLPNHPPTCVLAFCVDKARTDAFQQDSGTFGANQGFGLISKKDTDSGNMWNQGFILLFVTEVQWALHFTQLQATSQGQRRDNLQTLDENFEETRMFSGTNAYADLENRFTSMRDTGTPIYISFKDLFFRIFVHMALQTVQFNAATKSFQSNWKAGNWDGSNDWVAYNNRIRQMGEIYMHLEKLRHAQESLVLTDYAVAHSVAPSGTVLACAAVGMQGSVLQILQPANAASFSVTTTLVFAGVSVTRSHCPTNSECEKMFGADTNLVTFNNTHPRIEFGDFYMFLLEDISFEIHAATGPNVLDFELSTPQVMGRFAVVLQATLYWRRKPTAYWACSDSHPATKHATITDPVAFTKIQQAFTHYQCTNVDYA